MPPSSQVSCFVCAIPKTRASEIRNSNQRTSFGAKNVWARERGREEKGVCRWMTPRLGHPGHPRWSWVDGEEKKGGDTRFGRFGGRRGRGRGRRVVMARRWLRFASPLGYFEKRVRATERPTEEYGDILHSSGPGAFFESVSLVALEKVTDTPGFDGLLGGLNLAVHIKCGVTAAAAAAAAASNFRDKSRDVKQEFLISSDDLSHPTHPTHTALPSTSHTDTPSQPHPTAKTHPIPIIPPGEISPTLTLRPSHTSLFTKPQTSYITHPRTFFYFPWFIVGTEAVDEHVLGSGNGKRSGKQRGEETGGGGEKRGQSGSGVNFHAFHPRVWGSDGSLGIWWFLCVMDLDLGMPYAVLITSFPMDKLIPGNVYILTSHPLKMVVVHRIGVLLARASKVQDKKRVDIHSAIQSTPSSVVPRETYAYSILENTYPSLLDGCRETLLLPKSYRCHNAATKDGIKEMSLAGSENTFPPNPPPPLYLFSESENEYNRPESKYGSAGAGEKEFGHDASATRGACALPTL
ncbi:uncharacterized protein CLUP02_08893 [Colletotrichum lupini]|uniref:Uncharacterized protein n=1 Tax=Colletotrichum lupini TaxID=145971 RepID=A0A9Q8STX5_9PEZI|nr:uncharacterized protein CLUP02_08893 [Colletotrichum lupini]UQC83398.1 hypothetical protein CLUP02_08893 [Colletotrichum lupini]